MFTLKRNLFILIYVYCCISCVPTTDLFSESVDDTSTERFYIKFSENFYKRERIAVPFYELSSNDEIGLIDCGVSKDEESFEDIYCILDLNEADIGVLGQSDKGISIEYNVPRQMCEYTSFMAPWHWNQRSGFGPTDLCKYIPPQNTTTTNESARGDSSEVECYKLGSCPTNNPPTPPAGTCPPGFDRVRDGNNSLSERYCASSKEAVIRLGDLSISGNIPYDLSGGENSIGKNCCFGKYAVTESGGDVNSRPEIQEWGGKVQECIGGPLRSGNWDAYTKTDIGNVPIPKIFASWTQGHRETFEVGPVRQGEVIFTSVPTATYFDGIEDLIFTDPLSCANCPAIFVPDADTPIQDPSIRALLKAYPYFTLECLDSNHESLHRVHLIIREWNTKEEFLSFQDSDGRSGDPDLEGEEGGDCQYYEADEKLGSTKCNDFSDIDDYINNSSNSVFANPYLQIQQSLLPYPHVDYEGGGGGSQ